MAPASWALPLAWSSSLCLPAAAPGIFHREIWNPGNRTSGSPTLLISLLGCMSGQTNGWMGQMAKRPVPESPPYPWHSGRLLGEVVSHSFSLARLASWITRSSKALLSLGPDL